MVCQAGTRLPTARDDCRADPKRLRSRRAPQGSDARGSRPRPGSSTPAGCPRSSARGGGRRRRRCVSCPATTSHPPRRVGRRPAYRAPPPRERSTRRRVGRARGCRRSATRCRGSRDRGSLSSWRSPIRYRSTPEAAVSAIVRPRATRYRPDTVLELESLRASPPPKGSTHGCDFFALYGRKRTAPRSHRVRCAARRQPRS